MKTYEYFRSCPDFGPDDVHELNAMTRAAKDITYRTMAKHCAGLKAWARAVGFDRDLPLSKDWMVSYHKSTVFGRRCYYLRWSAFEIIWIERESARNRRERARAA